MVTPGKSIADGNSQSVRGISRYWPGHMVDDRMPRRARVLRRVTVGRVVAAMRATALLTGTEMNPGSADLDALLALPSFWVLDAGNGSDVHTTLIGHDILYGRST